MGVNNYECLKCKHKYNLNNNDVCPKCKTGPYKRGDAPQVQPTSTTKGNLNSREGSRGPVSPRSSHSMQVAIKSAKIVNAYGTYIQVLGIVIGVVLIVGGFYLAHQSGSPAYAVGGIIVGLLDIAAFAVQGALFRMISNYVIARLENQ